MDERRVLTLLFAPSRFTLTAVATEDDGDVAFTTSESFFVTFNQNTNGTGINFTILEPDLDIFNVSVADGTNIALEDNLLAIALNATENSAETLNPVITVTISNVPSGFTIIGALFNPITGEYSASAADVAAGLVRIQPPPNYSGFANFTVEAVATDSGATSLSNTSGEQILTVYFDPVADGFNIGSGPGQGFEDTLLSYSISFGSLIGEEQYFGTFYYIIFDDPTLASVLNYTLVSGGDFDATIFGTSLVGYYRIPITDTTVFIEFLENWHGPIEGDILLPVIEGEWISSLDLVASDEGTFASGYVYSQLYRLSLFL